MIRMYRGLDLEDVEDNVGMKISVIVALTENDDLPLVPIRA